MSWEEVGKQITVIGAVIAAATGIWNFWWQIRGKNDRFAVRMGGLSPSIEPETMMHVVSLSDHPIKLKDWGFIEIDGSFQSARMAWETGQLHSEETTDRGAPRLCKAQRLLRVGLHTQKTDFGCLRGQRNSAEPTHLFQLGRTILAKALCHVTALVGRFALPEVNPRVAQCNNCAQRMLKH